MALLSDTEKAELRREIARGAAVNYVKAEINSALQSIEDWFDKPAVKASLNTDIEAAAPGVFTAAQKRRLIKHWLRNRFGRE